MFPRTPPPSSSPCEAALTELPESLLVGVSGGMDSVALIHALVKVGRKPVILHFDHGWRAKSGADANWVHNLADELDLKYIGGKMRAAPKDRTEGKARAARFGFFAKTAKRLGIPNLVLAHHADDQVETFLMQLLRGSGAAGRGMDPLVKNRRDGLILHRPWLGLWRKEVAAYAKRHHLKWREDTSNADTRHRRNQIRLQVLPYLQKQFSPQVMESLLRATEIARAEGEWLNELVAEEATKPDLSTRSLRMLPLARQRRTILRWLQHRGVNNISFADVEAVRGLLENTIPAKINLSEGRFARRRTGKIFVE